PGTRERASGRLGDRASGRRDDRATGREGEESRRDGMFIVDGLTRPASSVGAKCAGVLDSSLTRKREQHFAPTELGPRLVPVSITIPLLRSWASHYSSSTLPLHSTLSSEHFRATYPANLKPFEVEGMLRTLEAARLDMLARVGPASLSLPNNVVNVVIHETT